MQCLAKYRQSGRIPFGVVRYQAIQKKLGCAQRLWGRRGGRRRTPHLQPTPAEGEATGKVARRQGLQVGPARQLWVDRLEPAGGLQQYGRGLTAVIGEERELSPHELH